MKMIVSYVWWGVAVLVLGLTIAELIAFQVRVNRGRELGRAVAFSVMPPGASQKVLVAGDSTAVGTGARSPEESIAGRLHESFPQAEIQNIGENGLKTRDLREKLEQLGDARFDVVVLQIGGNDIIRFTPYGGLEQDIAAGLDLARQHSEQVVLFTSGNVGTAPLFPAPLRWVYARRTLRVREIFSRQAEQYGVEYVDLFQPLAGDPFAREPKVYYAADGFHPSGAGYGVWYQRIEPVVRAILVNQTAD